MGFTSIIARNGTLHTPFSGLFHMVLRTAAQKQEAYMNDSSDPV